MARMAIAIILISFLCNEAGIVFGDIGTATSYNPPYLPTKCHGNRQDQFPPGNLFVSVGEGLWDNGAACGRRYRLRCLSGNNRPCKDGTIDVRVVDFCRKTPCPSTILLSSDAFSAVSHSQSTKINVEYIQYVSSPVVMEKLRYAAELCQAIR
ncbi:hypothetical protein DKX38_027832 [Salix brachista]|uniref:Expansin-like EG45 domain-containing protein n=1 Tax=Salix brachista TaxID=2182728 RepID=A0A5N5J653_9ROSI|nr:hypothetical protein DKX38_027832 [Salix brachista]